MRPLELPKMSFPRLLGALFPAMVDQRMSVFVLLELPARQMPPPPSESLPEAMVPLAVLSAISD